MKESRLACDECGATGWTRTGSGHADICSKCFGLGYVEEKGVKESPERRRKISHFYTIIAFFVVALVIYYLGLYLFLITYGFSFLETMVLFVGGHVAIFGGFLIFVTLRLLNQNREEDKAN